MKFSRRHFVGVVFGAAVAATMPVSAQTLGQDYTLVSPTQPTDNPAKIEVIEFFSYGCPHCNDFFPFISAWAAKLPGDVVVKKVPITFGRAAWANIARLYYTLELTGDLARLDGAVFKAIHQDRANLFDESGIKDWVVSKGVNATKFSDDFKSFGVMSHVRRGDQLAQAYRIQGVPAIAIDGKYLVGGHDFNETLAIADKLIAKVRAEKAGKK